MSRPVILFLLLAPYFSWAQDYQNVELIGHWDKEGLPINIRDARFTEVFGFVMNGEEYGVIGSTLGTHIIHIPQNPTEDLTEASYIPGPQQGVNVIHRDYDVWQNYLYAVGEQGQPRLQIIDLSYLPDSTHMVYDSDSLITNAHNFRIDQTTGKAYVCGSSGIPMIILDLVQDPENPVKLLDYFDVGYVHDAFIRNDTAWLNCASQGLWVVDFADVNAPLVLGNLTDYPDQGYNHSGWVNTNASLYAFADETEGMRMKLCDITDLSDIQVTDLFNSEGASNAIPHNLMIIGDLVYVSHYFDGLQIFNISDPFNVERVAWYDTSVGEDICCWGAWGVYPFLPSRKILISDRQNGFYVFRLDLDDPNPLAAPFGNDGFEPLLPPQEMVFYEVFSSQGKLVDFGERSWADAQAHFYKSEQVQLSDGVYLVKWYLPEGAEVSRFIIRSK
jgi:choice-of-anchor B domain-containing protein